MKKLLGKIVFFIIVLFFLQSLLTDYLLKFEDPKLENYVFRFDQFTLLNHYLREKADIIYLGDSSIYAEGKDDSDHRTIAAMLRDMSPQYTLGSVTHAAYHIDIYLEFCKYIVREGYRPPVIIIPINMRSFSPDWDRRPHYQYEIQKIVLKGGFLKSILLAFYKPLRMFKYNFFTISQQEFMDSPVFYGHRQVGVVKDFNNSSYSKYSDKNMKNQLIFAYMYGLSSLQRRRKLDALVETARLLKKNSIKCIFYITPIDWETGEKYLPGEFLKQLQQNTRLIVSLLSAEGVEILDISTALPAQFFYWHLYPNEHMNQRGRMYVAEQLSSMLKRVLAK
ncbi:MAG: hypothetical protein NT166_11655 [Candidatus Aminicenantes bacterium]|nr:hypothetical protein [Candidatus Aminicenantes bacterium]